MKISVAILAGLMLAGSISTVSAAEPTGNYTLDVRMKNVPDSVQFTLGSDDFEKYKLKQRIVGDSLHFELDIEEDFPIEFYLTARNPADKSDRFIKSFYGAKGVSQRLENLADGFFCNSVSICGAPWDEVTMKWDDYSIENSRLRRVKSKLCSELYAEGQKNNSGRLDGNTEVGRRFQTVQKELMTLQKQFSDSMRSWILAHPDVPEAVSLMTWRYADFEPAVVADFASKVPAAMMLSPKGKVLKRIVDTKVIAVGDKLADYDIVGEDVVGAPIKLSQFTTPYILVDFNSLGCGACRRAAKNEIPQLIEDYAGKLTFVSFSVDDDRKRMERAHELDKATWTTIWDGQGSSGMACLKYGVTSYPTFFLFGPERTLLMTESGWGPGVLHTWLAKFMGEPETKAAE